MIKELQRVIDFELNTGVLETTTAQKSRIRKAEIEIKTKKTISAVEANKEIAAWLEK
ncbi:MAG: hypothetical protein H7Y86_00365 [Rhizobacter sp.]|nr:hypothetical protein [Ferruginibacter sp.]